MRYENTCLVDFMLAKILERIYDFYANTRFIVRCKKIRAEKR